MDEILDVTLHVVATFERLCIPYLIGGSLASSLHGIPRATQDRQWSDALGVLRVTGSRLDLEYLRTAAARLGVQDLLERALQEAGEPA